MKIKNDIKVENIYIPKDGLSIEILDKFDIYLIKDRKDMIYLNKGLEILAKLITVENNCDGDFFEDYNSFYLDYDNNNLSCRLEIDKDEVLLCVYAFDVKIYDIKMITSLGWELIDLVHNLDDIKFYIDNITEFLREELALNDYMDIKNWI